MNQTQSLSQFLPSFDGELIYLEKYWKQKNTEETLIILHGICGDTNATLPLVEELLKRNNSLECIVPDLRGHGYSSRKLHSGNDLETILAKDLLEIIKCQNKPVHVIGHSYGGFIMQKLLEIEPDFPRRKLFFISTYFQVPTISISRKFWFKLLQKKKSYIVKTKRSSVEHLKYQYSHDFSPWRLLADMRFFGISHYFFLYAATFGWKSISPKIINHSDSYLFYGKNDLIFTQRQEENWLKQVPLVEGKIFLSNHNTLTNIPDQLAEAIIERLR